MRFSYPLPATDLNLATLFLAEELAGLPGCLYYIKARLTFAFEIKDTAAIHETGVVGNEVMSAVITNLVLLA